MTRSRDTAVPAQAPAPAPTGLTPGRAAALIVILVSAAYGTAFSGGAFVFDDQSSIVENQAIRRLWPLTTVLSPPPDAGVGGRPLPHLSYALNFAISGLEPWSYHTLAIVLHVGSALMLFGLVRRTLALPAFAVSRESSKMQARATVLGLAVALLWAVHPLTTAVIDYISQRTEALMALCYLSTLYGFVRASTASPAAAASRRRWSVVCVVCCAAGMASKETMVTAPLLALLYDRTFVGGTFRTAWRERAPLHLALAATWLLLAALMQASPVAQRGVGFALGLGALDHGFTSAGALIRYLQLALWPDPLVFDYGWAFVRDARTAAPALAACAVLLAATGFALGRRPALGFAGAALLLILAPTTSFIPIIHQPIAESRMYLPLAAIVAIVVLGGHQLLASRPRLLIAGAVTATLTLGTLTLRRHADYATEISLWGDTVGKRPDNARAHGQLGASLLRAGRLDDSIAASAAAVRLRPSYPDAHNNLGTAHARAGRPAEAIPHYENVLRLDPGNARAHYNLGHALAATQRIADAVAAFQAALRHNPRLAEAHFNLGVIEHLAGRPAVAAAHFEAALAIKPDYAEARQRLELARSTR